MSGTTGVGVRSPCEASTDDGNGGDEGKSSAGDDAPPVASTGAATATSRSGRTSATPASEKKKERKVKPKTLKSSAPKIITKEGTYYRVLNEYFDERHRPDVIKMGASKTRSELDAREFKNKRIYDTLVHTYLE